MTLSHQPLNDVALPRRPRTLIDAKAAAALLGVPLSTCYDLARAGKLPGTIRIGTRVRFDLEKLTAWLDAGGDLATSDGAGEQ